jgi:DNA invertase Pin-like site-specific DNA recombinase
VNRDEEVRHVAAGIPKLKDAEGTKRRALKLAAHAASRADVAEKSKANAIRFASQCGASLREIAEATGVPHVTVKRIIDRQQATA